MCPEGNPNKKRPSNLSKMELVKYCYESVITAFPRSEITFLVDKPNLELINLIDSCPNLHTIATFHFGSWDEGNIGTFHNQLDLAVKDGGKVLLLEDDYFFLPGAEYIIENALDKLEFLTPYDHPGYYTEDIHNYKREIIVAGGHHWQTITSTTLTFATTSKALENVIETMKKYGWQDHNMWLEITKNHKLYSPIPSLATHMESPYLAPAINWGF
jgi:hypothetical protein